MPCGLLEGKTDEEIADELLRLGHAPQLDFPQSEPVDTEKAKLIKKRWAEYWDTKSDEEIASVLLAPYEDAEATRPFLLPRFDDITLFTLAATFVLLLLMSGDLESYYGPDLIIFSFVRNR